SNEKNIGAELAEAIGNRQEKGAASGQQNALVRKGPSLFDQRLPPPGSHDAGEGPAWERKKQFARAGRQDETAATDGRRTVILFRQEPAGLGGRNYGCAIQQRDAGRMEPLKPMLRRSLRRTQLLSSPDLATEPGSFIHQRDAG